MCFDICTINIRVSIRVRGLHLVLCSYLPQVSNLKSQLLIKLFPPFPLPWLWRSKLSKVGKSEGNKDAT